MSGLMIHRLCIALVLTVFCVAAKTVRADYDPAKNKPAAVGVFNQTWHDKDRNRDVPVKVYYPRDTPGPRPVILFSHGLGASNEQYAYLGWYWAGRGYVSVHLTHHGSDTGAILSNGFHLIGQTGGKIARDPQNAVDRCADVSFAIDRLTTLNTDAGFPLHGRMDLDEIGMAGHSFGGNTSLMVAGQTFGERAPGKDFVDKRIKCAVAMSPPVVVSADQYDESFAKISIPTMVLSGTLDNAPIAAHANDERVAAFKFLTHAPADLVVLNGGDHQVFVGTRFGREKPGDARAHLLVQQATEAFFDAYLKKDTGAKKWLEGGGFAAVAGNDAELTHH